jgi:hypothetical protein
MNFVGSKRKMFRKKRSGKTADGIMASSPELMNEVTRRGDDQPVTKLAGGGDAGLEAMANMLTNQLFTGNPAQQKRALRQMQMNGVDPRQALSIAQGEGGADALRSLIVDTVRPRVNQGPSRNPNTGLQEFNMTGKLSEAERFKLLPRGEQLRQAAMAQLQNRMIQQQNSAMIPSTIVQGMGGAADRVGQASANLYQGGARLAGGISDVAGEVADVAREAGRDFSDLSTKGVTGLMYAGRGQDVRRQLAQPQADDSIVDRIGRGAIGAAESVYEAGRQVPGMMDQAGDFIDYMTSRGPTKITQDALEEAQRRGLIDLPGEAEREKALEGSTLEEKQREQAMEEAAKAAQERAKVAAEQATTKEAPAAEAKDPLETGMSKLAKQSMEGKKSKTNDLLVRIGLNIAAGKSPDALTNIAEGTLKGLDSYRAEELYREKAQPEIIKTLKYLEDADLSDSEKEAVMDLLTKTKKTSGQTERLMARAMQALSTGNITLAKAYMESAGIEDPEVYIEELEKQGAIRRPATTAQSAEDEPGMISKGVDAVKSFFSGDDE